jgi:hypothetical protein
VPPIWGFLPDATGDPVPRLVRCGDFEADVRAGKLRKQEVKIKLQKQPEMLEMLLERPHEVISQCRQTASCPSAMPMRPHSPRSGVYAKARIVLKKSEVEPRLNQKHLDMLTSNLRTCFGGKCHYISNVSLAHVKCVPKAFRVRADCESGTKASVAVRDRNSYYCWVCDGGITVAVGAGPIKRNSSDCSVRTGQVSSQK